jgi:TM2 domain-containing membrane protein YozV/predicted RNA-binding Zn-ribbon protein involved in translation (DUF1610 family)
MYCTNCGKRIADTALSCLYCGSKRWIERNYCANCGEARDGNKTKCDNCGFLFPEPRQKQRHPSSSMISRRGTAAWVQYPQGQKDAIFALILSVIIPGLGQAYCGQIGKGIVIFLSVALVVLSMYAIIGFIFLPMALLFNWIDAFMTGKKVESGRAIRKWEFF